MLFQALDDKGDCIGLYCNGELKFNQIPDGLTQTWGYSNFLSDLDVEYASIYCEGKTIDEICPTHLVEEWGLISNKLKAFVRSNKLAKVSLAENCFFDVTPERFLLEFCQLKNEICEWVFEKYPRPENYDHMERIAKVLSDIKYRKVKLELSPLRKWYHEKRARDLYRKLHDKELFCDYNQYGSVTGRLTLFPGSFPLMNLKKEYREIVKPNNDLFIELDYNSAEVRVVLALMGMEQPEEDIHEYHANKLYNCSRDEAKKRFFAWLYNPNSEDHISSGQYDRDMILSRYRSDDQIENLFKRKIKCDDFHAFNYLIQSTCADMVLDRMCDIYELLSLRRTYIAYTLHDSIILDYSIEDKDIFKDIINIYKNTKLGNFKVNISGGKDLYNLKKITI